MLSKKKLHFVLFSALAGWIIFIFPVFFPSKFKQSHSLQSFSIFTNTKHVHNYNIDTNVDLEENHPNCLLGNSATEYLIYLSMQ